MHPTIGSAMLAYLDSVSNDQLSLVKLISFALYTAATVGVVVGVYLESEKFSAATKERGWKLLVISLAQEIFLAIIIFSLDWEVSRRQGLKVSEINSVTEQLKSNNLVLTKAVLARKVLTVPNIREILDDLRQLPKTTALIQVVDGDREASVLARELATLFQSSGWKAEIIDEAHSPMLPGQQIPEGVKVIEPTINIPYGESYQRARALAGVARSLAEILTKAGLGAGMHPVEVWGSTGAKVPYLMFNKSLDDILIVIGSRPVAQILQDVPAGTPP
jgi:hypothetical protein